MTLNTSEVDINNVTSVPKLNGFFLVKADLQGHNSNERHTDNLISVTDTAGAVRDRMQIVFMPQNIWTYQKRNSMFSRCLSSKLIMPVLSS